MNTASSFLPEDYQKYLMEDATHPPLTSLKAEMPAVVVCKQIIRGQLGDILLHTPIALEGSDIEGIHKMRVGFRRLRTGLKLFKPLIDSQKFKYFQTNTRSAGLILGSIRDLDVLHEDLLTTFATQNPSVSSEIPEIGFWQSEILPRYQLHRDEFITLIKSPGYIDFLVDLIAFCKEKSVGIKPDAVSSIRQFAPRQIRNSLQDVLEYADNFDTRQPYPVYHQLRKEVKRFRYALEFFSPLLAHPQTEIMIENLVSLQDHLGKLNDAVVATHFFETMNLEETPKQLNKPIFHIQEYARSRQAEMDQLLADFPHTWEAFLHTAPQKLLEGILHPLA